MINFFNVFPGNDVGGFEFNFKDACVVTAQERYHAYEIFLFILNTLDCICSLHFYTFRLCIFCLYQGPGWLNELGRWI